MCGPMASGKKRSKRNAKPKKICYDSVDDNFPFNIIADRPIASLNTPHRTKSKFCHSVINSENSIQDYNYVENFLINFNLEFYLDEVGDDLSCNGPLGELACRYSCGKCDVSEEQECYETRNDKINKILSASNYNDANENINDVIDKNVEDCSLSGRKLESLEVKNKEALNLSLADSNSTSELELMKKKISSWANPGPNQG